LWGRKSGKIERYRGERNRIAGGGRNWGITIWGKKKDSRTEGRPLARVILGTILLIVH